MYIWPIHYINSSTQDIVVGSALCVCCNRSVHLDFTLHLKHSGSNDSKLKDSMFCMLGSTEFTGLMCGLSVVAVCITNPLRWFSAKTHTLAQHGWSMRRMSSLCDDLKEVLDKVVEDHTLFLIKNFTKNIF